MRKTDRAKRLCVTDLASTEFGCTKFYSLEDKQDEYEIISGHRRVHAAELLEMQ